MTKCKSHIIPASTFSWWGVYLNSNENKKVYVPDPVSIPDNIYGQYYFYISYNC